MHAHLLQSLAYILCARAAMDAVLAARALRQANMPLPA